ncbi:MAG: alcohol dehydrogenase catalytic domain-containing protein, partial [Planctomycetaceae bacterium]
MLAGEFTAPQQIALIEVPEPTLSQRPATAQILFQPEITCLCGSDIPFFDHSPEVPLARVGHSLHEMVGTVVDTNGDRFQAGERVLAVPMDQRGLFERFVLDETRAIPLSTGQPDEHLMLAQPLGTVLFALKKLPTILDLDVAVVGQGPIGQMFCAALRNLGARHIIGIDPIAQRLE